MSLDNVLHYNGKILEKYQDIAVDENNKLVSGFYVMVGHEGAAPKVAIQAAIQAGNPRYFVKEKESDVNDGLTNNQKPQAEKEFFITNGKVLKYNGKILKQFREKTAGKNNSPVDGFYVEVDDENADALAAAQAGNEKYFVKKPDANKDLTDDKKRQADDKKRQAKKLQAKKELFLEGFTGEFIKELFNSGLIDETYRPSLICASFAPCEDGYALIQPCVKFTELFKIIGTGYSDGSDRNPFYEMLFGPQCYPKLLEQNAYMGLSVVFMLALLVGNYSAFHSGNVVLLHEKHFQAPDGTPIAQYAGVDNGAANRYLAHPENNKNILDPYEYQKGGWTNISHYTKGYVDNYREIDGLLSSIAAHATQLGTNITATRTSLVEILIKVFQGMPADIADAATLNALAEYTCIPAFSNATFGPKGNCKELAEQYAKIFELRLNKIQELQDTPAPQAKPSAKKMYASTSPADFQAVGLSNKAHEVKSDISGHENVSAADNPFGSFIFIPGAHAAPAAEYTEPKHSKEDSFSRETLVQQPEVELVYSIYNAKPDVSKSIDTTSDSLELILEPQDDKQSVPVAVEPEVALTDVNLKVIASTDTTSDSSVLAPELHDVKPLAPVAPVVTLVLDDSLELPEQLTRWQAILEQRDHAIPDVTQLDYAKLVRLFNDYVNYLAEQGDNFNLWQHDTQSNRNLLAPFSAGNNGVKAGYAFVPQYREGPLLQGLYTQPSAEQFAPYKAPNARYCRQAKVSTSQTKPSAWHRITTALESAQTVLDSVKELQDLQVNSNLNEEANQQRLKQFHNAFVEHLQDFQPTATAVKRTIDENKNKVVLIEASSETFYPISNRELDQMSGEQLVSICLAELAVPQVKSSELAARIMTNDYLWLRVNEIAKVFFSSTFGFRPDSPEQTLAYLQQSRQCFVDYRDSVEQFYNAADLPAKTLAYATLQEKFEQLPLFLQAEVNSSRDKGKGQADADFEQLPLFLQIEVNSSKLDAEKELKLWQTCYENYTAQEQNYKLATSYQARLDAYPALEKAFNELPSELAEPLRTTFTDYKKEIGSEKNYLDSCSNFKNEGTIEGKIVQFERVKKHFCLLSRQLKEDYCSSFSALTKQEKVYESLVSNQCVLPAAQIAGVDTVVERINNCGTQNLKIIRIHNNLQRYFDEKQQAGLPAKDVPTLLLDAAKQDAKLWQAIAAAEKTAITQEVALDLLLLNAFVDEYKELGFDAPRYVTELGTFYEKALSIRLSNSSVKDQAQQITAAAHEFTHRHRVERFMADFVMLLTFFFGGVLVMAGRLLTHRTALFSTAATARETFIQGAMQPQQLLADDNYDGSLFSQNSIEVK